MPKEIRQMIMEINTEKIREEKKIAKKKTLEDNISEPVGIKGTDYIETKEEMINKIMNMINEINTQKKHGSGKCSKSKCSKSKYSKSKCSKSKRTKKKRSRSKHGRWHLDGGKKKKKSKKLRGGGKGGWGIIRDLQAAGKMLGGWSSPKPF